MKFLGIFANARSQNRDRRVSSLSIASRTFSQLLSHSEPPSFGIAFDIDGVILRGDTPIGGSPIALKRLYDDCGTVRTPYVFLTNGGGTPESKRASQLSKLLGVNISPLQLLQGHSPFKQLVNRYENELVIALGKGEPKAVMTEYGFKNVVSIEEYASCFDNIDPLAPYKKWTTGEMFDYNKINKTNFSSQRVQAVFVVSDSVDWSRDVQVLCDILRTGGVPGGKIAHQPPLYFAHDDLLYQSVFPAERFGMGAFRIALESVFNSVYPKKLEYTCFGKPNPLVFKNAEMVLKEFVSSSWFPNYTSGGDCKFKTLYMIGDNPNVDIRGSRQAGHPWFSILLRTGVFKGKGNHNQHPADLVVDDVQEAVDYIITKEYNLVGEK